MIGLLIRDPDPAERPDFRRRGRQGAAHICRRQRQRARQRTAQMDVAGRSRPAGRHRLFLRQARAYVRLADGTTKEFAENAPVEGLAFAPKGLRIAVARYNGVSLHWVGRRGKPVDLEWKGAHTGVTFSPDGNFLVTTMQENALHGWKLADGKHMRMTGYPAKVKSLSWSAKGKWLASSGAPAAIVWPFQGKDGPMGKAPLELGTRANIMVTCVAFHPADDILAIGYHRRHDPGRALRRQQGSAAAPPRQGRDHLDELEQGRKLPGLRLRDGRLRRRRHFGLTIGRKCWSY